MTTTYEPAHPEYSDEADVRGELTRVFDICNGCRLCVDRCGSFPTLFDMIDRHGGDDAGRLTPLQQDEVVDQCFQCNRCVAGCPYAPDRHEWDVDVPRLMLRGKAMQYQSGVTSMRSKLALLVSGHTDMLGGLVTSSPPVYAIAGRRARSMLRRALRTAHVGRTEPGGTGNRERFSEWFARRASSDPATSGSGVTVFPACVVEYEEPGIGKALVEAYDHAGIGCSITSVGCCGAPWLHAGDIDRFAKVARRNVDLLAAEIRQGRDLVVAEPTCLHVIVQGYPDHVPTPDAAFVASHTFGATEYLTTGPGSGRGAADPTE